MKKLLLTFLTIVIQLGSSTSPDASKSPVFCRFIGLRNVFDYKFNINDVKNELKSCDKIVYSFYYFDDEPVISSEDIDAITALIGINKTVYVCIQYWFDDNGWSELLNPDENGEVFKTKIDALVKFLSDHKISGVIMTDLPLYQPDSPATAKNIAEFAKKLKTIMKNNLKVGMLIDNHDYQQFSNNTAFSYDVTNPAIDNYFIDVTESNECNNKTKHSSVNPIKSNDSALLTLEDQSIAVSKSTMDKSKVVVVLQAFTTSSNSFSYASYSELCSYTKKEKTTLNICSDYTDTLYNQGKFATQYYSGIMIAVEEGDDIYNHCNCGPFIVSNLIISGWKCAIKPTCTKLDEFMKIE